MARLADFTTDTYNGIAPKCVRSTGGYAETVAGQLVWFIADDARITDKGLLVEPAAVNQFLWSQTLEQSYWRGAGAGNTSQTDYITAPDGTVTAEDITNAGSLAQLGNNGFGVAPSTQTITVSGFFKRDPAFPNQQPFIQVNHSNGGLKASVQPFNATTPAPAPPYDLIPTVSFAGATITAMANGWYRFAAMVTVNAAGTVEAYLGHAIGTGDRSTGQPSDAYLWGFQFEAGAKATSYFPTTSAAATRAADQVSFTIPAGVTTLTFTFDDGSTQDKTVTPGATYTVPTDLNRAYIKYIDGAGAAGPTYTLTAVAAIVGTSSGSVTLKRSRRVTVSAAAVAIGRLPALLLRRRRLIANPRTVAVQPAQAALTRSRRLSVVAGAASVATMPVALRLQRRLTAEAGAVGVAGGLASMIRSRVLALQPASVVVTGLEATFSTANGGQRQLTVTAASVVVTGGVCRIIRQRRVEVKAAPVAVAPQPATLAFSRRLQVVGAQAGVVGQSAGMTRRRLLQAEGAPATVSAGYADLRLSRRLVASPASVTLAGQTVQMTLIGNITLVDSGLASRRFTSTAQRAFRSHARGATFR